VTPETPKEERIAICLPAQKSMYEIADGEPWEALLKKGMEDDVDNGWIDAYGGMNPYSILAWALMCAQATAMVAFCIVSQTIQALSRERDHDATSLARVPRKALCQRAPQALRGYADSQPTA